MKTRATLLLAIGLIVTAAWAQTGRTSAAKIDSQGECTALGGTWGVTGDGWRSACAVPWERQECLRLGGFWTEIAKSSAGGRCVAGVSEPAVAQQCRDRGGSWGLPGSRSPQCSFERAKAKSVPLAKAPDANKLCDSQKDCTYGCVYDGPPVAAHADVMGHCRATNIAAGCFSMVEAGRLAGSICVK